MKKITVLYFAMVLQVFWGISVMSQEISVKTKITRVTVFLKGAQITRKGITDLPGGRHTLVFRSLSSDLQQNSIQVEGEGDFVIFSVKRRINYLKKGEDNPELLVLRKKLDTFTQSKENISVQMQVLKSEEEMLDKNQIIGGSQNGLSVTALANALEFYSKKLSDVKTRQLEINRKLKMLNEKIRQVNLQIGEWSQKQKKSTGEVVVTVSAKKEQKASFLLSYYTERAGWRPEYDVRVEDITKNVLINYKAYVKQTTGEKWTHVPITLSTGNPAIGGIKPELSTWYLDFKPPVRYNQYKAKVKYSTSKRAMNEMTTPAAGTAAAFTTTVQKQTTTQFEIAEPYTIPSDNREQVVIIKNIKLPAIYAYNVVPKLDKDAFLMAGISDWKKHDFLSGKMNLFFEGTYVGNSYLDAASAQDTLFLTLGRDRRIKVERKKMVDFTRKQMLGSNVRELHGWEIRVMNTKNLPVHVTIEEQIPVSKRKEIVVDPVDLSGARLNPVTGKCVWDIHLKPGQAKSVTLKFSVKYPKNKQVYIE